LITNVFQFLLSLSPFFSLSLSLSFLYATPLPLSLFLLFLLSLFLQADEYVSEILPLGKINKAFENMKAGKTIRSVIKFI